MAFQQWEYRLMAFCDKKSNGNQMPKHLESFFNEKATNRYRPDFNEKYFEFLDC